MRLLVNTLSIGSMSGEHVVYGFLGAMLQGDHPDLELLILHCAGQPPPPDLIDSGAVTIEVPRRLKRWYIRPAWEIARLPGLLRAHRIERVLNVSGGITPGLSVPQVSLCMNPWCYVADVRRGWSGELKAFMQRRSYRHAFRKADHMVYISAHLRSLYRRANRDCLADEAPSSIAFVGLDQVLFAAATQGREVDRPPYTILAVSAFASWKGVETVVHAVRLLRESGLPATLSLVGPWPDPEYHKRIRGIIRQLDLEDAVSIHGKLPAAELHRHYASHRVFCLMSVCESFGIPAAEAMAFGTPVVSTDCCAIAEVCAPAGLFGAANDPAWTAEALKRLLTNSEAWNQLSGNARSTAESLHWSQCARPLLKALGVARQSATGSSMEVTPSAGAGVAVE